VQSVVQEHHDAIFRYWIEQRDICPELPTNAPTPYAQQRSLAGQCLVGERVTEARGDVTIETHRVRDDALEAVEIDEEARFRLWGVREVRTFDVLEQHNGVMTHVERRTHIVGDVATTPFYIGVQGTGMIGMIPAAGRQRVILGGHTIESVLSQRYGWRIAPAESEGENGAMASAAYLDDLLARPLTPGVAFTEAEHNAIRAGLNDVVRREQHTAEEIETLRAVISSPAVVNYIDLFWKDDLVVLVPDVITRLETPLIHEEENVRYKLAQFAAKAPLETLRPYADRIIDILSDESRGRYAGSLAAIAPQLTDRDTTPILLNLVTNGLREGPISGVCLEAAPGRTDVAAGLGAFLSGNPFNARPGTTRAAMAGHMRSTSYEATLRLGDTLRDDDRRRYRRELARVRQEGWPAACDEYNGRR
jgi:hypothetical protein